MSEIIAQGPVDVNVRGDVSAEFDAILRSFGPTTQDSVIDQAIARCAVKKGRRASARLLIETAFDIARES